MNRPEKTWMFLLVLLTGLLSGPGVHAGDYRYEYEDDPAPSMITSVDDLQKLAMLAREKRVPILIEFSTPWCTYCEALEKEILEPMLKSGDYRHRVLIRKLEVNDYSQVIDFTGQSKTSIDLAMSLEVDFYPTLIFFNAEGKQISHRLVGITVLEFVFDEIEKRLVRAEKALSD